MKEIFKYLKPYRKETIITVLCVFLESSLEIVVPFLMNFILQNGKGITYDPITNIINSYDLPYVFTIGGIMIGCAALAFILGIFGAKYSAKCGRGLGAELRKKQYEQIQKYSFDNLDDFRTSSLITRLTNDVTIIQDAFTQSLRPALRSPTMLIFSLVLAFIISPYLGLIFLVVIPLLGLILFIILKIVRPKFKTLQIIMDKLNRTTQESIIAIKTIKAYVKEDYEAIKFNEVNTELKNTACSAYATLQLNMPAMQFATYTTIIALLTFGASFFTKGLIQDVSEISTFLSYIMQLLSSLMMLSNVFMLVSRSSPSVLRVLEVIKTSPTIIDNKDSKEEITSGNIEFKNVYFKYKKDAEKYVLSNINFKINHGEFVGIVGQTGSSKTTLINLMNRFYDASAGEVLIDNKNIKDYSLFEIHNKIANSLQNPILFKGTVKENLLYGNKNASEEEIIRATKIACCYDFVVNNLENGFETMIGQSGTNVSGGQRQRLCLARAILTNPKILILDDSFSALDRITENKVKENIKNNLKDTTLIVISQKISAIKDADKIIVLNNGVVNNIGTHQELLQKDEIYQNMDFIQSEGLN